MFNIFSKTTGAAKKTVREFELWIKEVEQGAFIVQERTKRVDVFTAANLEQAERIAKARGGYAVAKIDD